MSFLVDTDTCSAYLKGDRRVYSRFQQHTGQLHVATITAAELFTWALRRQSPPSRLADLLAFPGDMVPLEFDLTVARKFGEIRSQQLDQGNLTPEMDLMIAATALAHGLALVTHNTQDFAQVPRLSLQDWLLP